ncbi:MAG: SRPBCC domain-containing protein [Actinomycetota bacterium]|nr:SRPBCC domain-containing protein [Actinomycetota bacterium]
MQQETRITRSVELDASTADVWRALTEPALLGEWLDSVVELDVRPGGDGVLVDPDGAVRRARVEEVDPARRLALRWWPEDGSGPESTVELDLETTPEGTRVVVTETLVPPAAGSASTSTSASASASRAAGRWPVRLLLLGCCLLRSPVLCR